jgi:hypothetical protein
MYNVYRHRYFHIIIQTSVMQIAELVTRVKAFPIFYKKSSEI